MIIAGTTKKSLFFTRVVMYLHATVFYMKPTQKRNVPPHPFTELSEDKENPYLCNFERTSITK